MSVEKSEVLAAMLRKRGIPHDVLNAKQHLREAEIVPWAQAGRKGAVTISTNMAGRGTDILLGGNPEFLARFEVKLAELDVSHPELSQGERKMKAVEAAAIPGRVDENTVEYKAALEKYRAECAAEKKLVVAAGGLHIVGTERHESRRIDNQLRGRAGRQGDPGSSRFYLCLEDDLMRIFGAERIEKMMNWLGGWDESEPIEHGLVNKAIADAQRKVEAHHFDSRKNLLDYDDVMNQQRKSIYALRRQILEGRYIPEQPEVDRKAGKPWSIEPPVKSGKWTIDLLADQIRADVARVLEGVRQSAEPKPGNGEAGASANSGAPYRGEDEGSRLGDSDRATHELYRVFGVVSALKRDWGDHDRTLAKASRDAAASLIQQRERILDLAEQMIGLIITTHCPANVHAEEWDLDALVEGVREIFNLRVKLSKSQVERDSLAEQIYEQVEKWIEARETELRPLTFLAMSRYFFLDEIDTQWIENLKAMEHLREGIGLRGYGQRDPKMEYKKEGYNIFADMIDRISQNVAGKLFRVQLEVKQPAVASAQSASHNHGSGGIPELVPELKHKERRVVAQHPGYGPSSATPGDFNGGDGAMNPGAMDAPEKIKTVVRAAPKVGRNDPCPCGSGKKYKKCHGATAVA